MFGSAAEAKAARSAGLGQDRSGKSGSRDGWSGPTGMRGAGGYASPDGRLSQRADVQARASGVSDARANAAARAWADRISDYRNTYNSRWDNVGNRLANSLGFHEIAPSFDVGNLVNDADWGFDPVGGLAGLAGSVFAGPLGGLIAGRAADALSNWAGRPLEINLGPNVLGGTSRNTVKAGSARSPGTNGNRDVLSERAGRPDTMAVPSRFRPRFDVPAPAPTYAQTSPSAGGVDASIYRRTQDEMMRQWASYLQQAIGHRQVTFGPPHTGVPRAEAPADVSAGGATVLPAFIPAMSPYITERPHYGKSGGFAGVPRSAPAISASPLS